MINELEIPVMCIGAKDMVIAASYDGILISDKGRSEHIKTYADRLQCRPMYEERRWGEYKVINSRSRRTRPFQVLNKEPEAPFHQICVPAAERKNFFLVPTFRK